MFIPTYVDLQVGGDAPLTLGARTPPPFQGRQLIQSRVNSRLEGTQKMFITATRAAVVGLLITTPAAYGQTYRCNSNGSSYLSNSPCGNPSKAQIGMYGPSRSGAAIPFSSQLPAAPRAQEFVKYLPSGCASIIEAIRTAPARGARGDVIRGLQDEYEQKCSVDDQVAREKLRGEQSQQQQVKLNERDEALKERQLTKLRADQCGGMREVIALKRKRESALNSTEVEALRELERVYNSRCIAL